MRAIDARGQGGDHAGAAQRVDDRGSPEASFAMPVDRARPVAIPSDDDRGDSGRCRGAEERHDGRTTGQRVANGEPHREWTERVSEGRR